MAFLNKILLLCAAFMIPISAFSNTNTDDYDRCITMNTSKLSFKFNIKNKDSIFAEYPSYKVFYENYLNNPLEQKCDLHYSTGVGCDCRNCNIGEKLPNCVTPKQYGQACAEHIAFSEMEFHYREEWLKNELEKICGPAPSDHATEENANQSPTQNEQSPQKSTGQTKSDKKSDKAAQRKAKKEAECKAKKPPMDVKQNMLGLWVCTDSAETVAARKQQRQSNATLKAFWNDMDDLERAFNRRVKQLRQGGNK